MRLWNMMFFGTLLLCLTALAKDDKKLNTTPNIYPIKAKIVSTFGPYIDEEQQSYFNSGIDFSSKKGTSVIATADGKVKEVGNDLVILDHGDDYESVYKYMSDFKVKPGEAVKRGAILGSSMDKFHYEIRVLGLYVDPSFFIPAPTVKTQTE